MVLCEGPKYLQQLRCTDLSRAAFHRDGFQEVVEGHGVVLPIQILHQQIKRPGTRKWGKKGTNIPVVVRLLCLATKNNVRKHFFSGSIFLESMLTGLDYFLLRGLKSSVGFNTEDLKGPVQTSQQIKIFRVLSTLPISYNLGKVDLMYTSVLSPPKNRANTTCPVKHDEGQQAFVK